MKPAREVIGEELLRQIHANAVPTEDWFRAGDSVIRALEAAGYAVVPHQKQ